MICQNCQKEVADDLVFCTECGSRLFETTLQNPTVLMTDSIITNTNQTIPPAKSNLKWIALIVSLLAVPISLGLIYLILNNKSSEVLNNKPKTNSPTPVNRKSANQNNQTKVGVNKNNVENPANNLEPNSTNSNENANSNSDSVQIIDERLTLYAASDAATPFIVTTDNAKIIGNVEILQGDSYEGYVFTQEMYDQHHTDPTYKMFSFGETKKDEVEQYLPKGNYVIAFVNKSSKDVMIQAKFSQIPQ